MANAYAWENGSADDWERVELGRKDAPRVYPVYLDMKKPAFNQPKDPFVEFKDLAIHFMVKHRDWAMQTSAWESISDELWVEDIDEVASKDKSRFYDLYTQLYLLLDDPEFIAHLIEAGFDGAIHAGSGASMEVPEYRVFDEGAVIYALSVEPEQAPAPRKKRALESSLAM
ncbi:hypothetical protein ACYPKM_04475 [Pseudomonas aeruginosa]